MLVAAVWCIWINRLVNLQSTSTLPEGSRHAVVLTQDGQQSSAKTKAVHGALPLGTFTACEPWIEKVTGSKTVLF